MTLTSLYPVLMSADVASAADFYRSRFGFETTFEADWYVSLRLGTFELAVLAYDHPTIPAAYRKLPSGVLVNLEVDDVDAIYTRFEGDSAVVLELRDEDFGQRHFIAAAPDGVLVDVITPIAPSAEYVEAFAPSQ